MVKQVQHDTRAAVEFLKRWNPNGPWVLTSIIPDGKTDTVTFAAKDWQKAAEWIEAVQGQRNIYFHVNPVRRTLHSKASKEDVARLAWLHVDIDPRAGEDFAEERTRALRILQEYEQPPSVIVDSGGGFQGFWRLQPDAELEIDGDISRAEELEAYNIQLEKIFQADHCHNVDRIMRLPGTVNVPNAKKIKKGREPALAKLIEFNKNIYSIRDFVPAVRVQSNDGKGLSGGRPRVKITGNVPDMGTEELAAWAAKNNKQITETTLALIATGQDPMDPTKYSSRSEVLFRVCCDLVRADVPDEMVFAVITGSNEIASSVRDKPNWESYALRQIERAKEEAIDPVLRQLNEKHAVIADIGGKCRIISEVWEPSLKRNKISKQSFEDFRNRYRNVKVTVGTNDKGQPILKPAGSWWIDHPKRRQYETIVFAPGHETEEAFNLWRGFACDALPGDKHQSFLDHVLENVCSSNEEHYKYLISWMARCIQRPDSPGETAVVLRGRRGTGKGVFAKTMGHLFGRHFLQVSDSKHLVGSFNAHLRDTVLLFGDEAFFAGDKRHESVLKTLVTEEHLVIEGKGVDAEAAPNYTHLILASNEDWVVPAGLDERRFFVMEVGDGHKQDHNYFRRLKRDLDGGGYSNLLHYLMTYPLDDFEVRIVPQTTALQEQKILSMTPETQWLMEKLMEGRLLRGDQRWRKKIMKDYLYNDYINDMRDQGKNYRMGRVAFGKFLKRALPSEGFTTKQEVMEVPEENELGHTIYVKKRTWVLYLPKLAAVRDWWDTNFGGPFTWPVVDDDQEELDDADPSHGRPF